MMVKIMQAIGTKPKYTMMVRQASNKIGYTAFFYDDDTFVGETANIKLSGDISSEYSPVRKYPIQVMFGDEVYNGFVYEK